jgi:hypothetical protein
MKRLSGLAAGALVTIVSLVSILSCGHDQKLVSMQIQPASFTFLNQDPDAQEQFTVTGTYIHPPATKDITSQAKWSVDFSNVVTMNQGLVSPVGDGACGGVNITATAPEGTGGSGNIISAYATVTVDDPTNPLCPGGGTEATLSVQVTPTNLGSVTSLTGGINCPSVSCIATFPVGASVGLTAIPASGTSVTWSGCTASSGNDCSVTIPKGGANVFAQFQ